MRPIVYKRIILSALACQQLGYLLGGLGVWGMCNGLTHFLLWVCPVMLLKRPNDLIRKDRWAVVITWYGIVASVNQFIDENIWINSLVGFELFNPLKAGWNEYLILSGILIHAYGEYKKWWTA